MLFALICTDKPDALAIRQANRPAHLDWLKGIGDAVKLAGPFLTPDGAEPRGSLIVIDAPDMARAREIAAGDPYAKAGLFAAVDIRAWNWVINAPKA